MEILAVPILILVIIWATTSINDWLPNRVVRRGGSIVWFIYRLLRIIAPEFLILYPFVIWFPSILIWVWLYLGAFFIKKAYIKFAYRDQL